MTKQKISTSTIVAIIAAIVFVLIVGLYLRRDDSNGEETPIDAEIEISAADHVFGNPMAKISIVEFSDYQCSFCARFHETLQQIMLDYEGKVKWIFKHFPLSNIHPYAQQAAEAAECAGEQSKFWEYSDKLYARQSEIAPELFPKIATELELDTSSFAACLSSGKYTAKVNADQKMGTRLKVTGTPATFINGQLISGAQPYEKVKTIIDGLL